MAKKPQETTPLRKARMEAILAGEIRFTVPEKYRCRRCKGRERYVTSNSCCECARRQMRKKYAAEKKLIDQHRRAATH